MKSILKYVLRNGLRDRLYLSLFIALIATFVVSVILGRSMISEETKTALALIAGTFRTIIACGMILFVCITTHRSFENKEIEFILSKPISREKFILAYLFGFFIASLIIILPVFLTIFVIFRPDIIGLLAWLSNIIIENFIVVSIALISSLILKNAFSAIFAAVGFYAISRLMGVFLMAVNLPKNLDEAKFKALPTILKFISVAFPRLDLYSQTSWLVYGVADFKGFQIALWQALVYLPLLIFMSFHDFKKKQF